MSVSAGSSVVHVTAALMSAIGSAVTAEMTGSVMSTSAVAVVVAGAPVPSSASLYTAVMVSPSTTSRFPLFDTGAPSWVGMEPVKIAVSLPVSVSSTVSPVDSDVLAMVMEISSVMALSVLRSRSPTLIQMVLEPLYLVLSRLIKPVEVTLDAPVMTRAKGCGPVGTL